MKSDDLNTEAIALEAEIVQLQKRLHQCVCELISSSPYSKWLVAPNDSLKAAAADPAAMRTAINAGKADHGALVALLISLDVITLEQYQRARVQALRAEVTAYETVLAERVGQAVPLAVKPETGKGETEDV